MINKTKNKITVSDLDLIKKIKKKNDIKSKYELFNRYVPFIHKKYNKMFIQLKKTYEFDDFLSLAYIEFEKAVNYVNIDKIYDNNWKFLGVYMYYLNNLVKDLYVQYKHTNSIQSDITIESDHVLSYEDKAADQVFDSILLKETLNTYKPADNNERKIVSYLINHPSCKNIFEISKNTGVTFYTTKRILEKIYNFV